MLKPAVTLASLLLVGACGLSDHNDADVRFATDMVEHHAQAIQMANYTIGRTGIDPRIAELAEEIRLGQTREIDTMAGWLRQWDEPVPETGFATGDGHTHDSGTHGDGEDTDMPGMLSPAAMDRLAAAPDRAFERMWIEMMIAHHEGAVSMAREFQDDGRHAELGALAERIDRAQRAEIGDLRSWLDET